MNEQVGQEQKAASDVRAAGTSIAAGRSASADRAAVARPALTQAGSRWAFLGPSKGILAATILLFVLSWVVQPQSLSGSALAGMLPFAAVLVFIAIGQTLVVQQGGIDLSVPGMVSLSVIIVSYCSHDHAGIGGLLAAILVAIAAAVVAGVVNGLLVSRVGVAPIVATIGMNAVLFGFNMKISGGTPVTVASALSGFVNIKILDVSILVYLAIVMTGCVSFLIKKTVFGRYFEAVGSNARAARAAGVMSGHYQLAAYAGAGLIYALAGTFLAGLMQLPSAFEGNVYLLPSIAAVVLGGTSLFGGPGNLTGTAIAALFLTQLQQLVQTTGSSIWVQYVFQGGAIIIGVGVYSIRLTRLRTRFFGRLSRG